VVTTQALGLLRGDLSGKAWDGEEKATIRNYDDLFSEWDAPNNIKRYRNSPIGSYQIHQESYRRGGKGGKLNSNDFMAEAKTLPRRSGRKGKTDKESGPAPARGVRRSPNITFKG